MIEYQDFLRCEIDMPFGISMVPTKQVLFQQINCNGGTFEKIWENTLFKLFKSLISNATGYTSLWIDAELVIPPNKLLFNSSLNKISN